MRGRERGEEEREGERGGREGGREGERGREREREGERGRERERGEREENTSTVRGWVVEGVRDKGNNPEDIVRLFTEDFKRK